MLYFWETTLWPRHSFDLKAVVPHLSQARQRQGELQASLRAIGFNEGRNLAAEAIAETAVGTSKIEGEDVDIKDARSSVARKLGIETLAVTRNRQTDGLANILVDATFNLEPLTEERLFQWHKELFVDGYRHFETLGGWRKCPMKIVSGRLGREKLHFEAMEPSRLRGEMAGFLQWINGPHADDLIVVAGLAHLVFETIHPFEDGNGRIGRAITDNILARAEPSLQGVVSLAQILYEKRRDYQAQLEIASKNLFGDCTEWICWHTDAYATAVKVSIDTIQSVLAEQTFWATHAESISKRQYAMLKKFLQAGFEGTIRADKYAKLAKVSPDTAQRDLADLLKKGFLTKNPGLGKKTSYSLDLNQPFS